MTGSIQASLPIAYQAQDRGTQTLKYTNGNAGTLQEGQEVFISGDNEVDKRVDGTTFPIGTVFQKALTGETVVVCLQKPGILEIGKAIGGAITAGAPVVPNGSAVLDADGNLLSVGYVLAVSGDNYMAIAQTGAAENGTFRVLQLANYTVLA